MRKSQKGVGGFISSCLKSAASNVRSAGVSVAGLGLVVDQHGGAVAQLERAGADHRLALLDAGQHRHLVAARAPKLLDRANPTLRSL